jgi:hypothetical protein
MTFSVDAGVLNQLLPTLSGNGASKPLAQENHNGPIVAPYLAGVMEKPHKQRANRNAFQALGTGRALKSAPFANTITNCDPFSDDPDIGILSCDAGFECIGDPASTLGGVCTSTSRELQAAFCDLCGPVAFVPDENYLIPIPSYEGVTCGTLDIAAYEVVNGTYTIDVPYCPTYAQIAQDSGCCVSIYGNECSLCGDATFYADLVLDLAGMSVACSVIQSNLNSTACAEFSDFYAGYCCGPPVVPTPAPQGSKTKASVPTPPTVVPTLAPQETPAPASVSAPVWSTSAFSLILLLAATTAVA